MVYCCNCCNKSRAAPILILQVPTTKAKKSIDKYKYHTDSQHMNNDANLFLSAVFSRIQQLFPLPAGTCLDDYFSKVTVAKQVHQVVPWF